jgi:hypothetical protein
MADIVLAVNQSAASGQCGGCALFERDPDFSEYVTRGRCKLKLPPTRVFKREVWDGDSMPLTTVNDTDECSFWKSSGKTYIVSRRVKP